jgi:hypothetical protein
VIGWPWYRPTGSAHAGVSEESVIATASGSLNIVQVVISGVRKVTQKTPAETSAHARLRRADTSNVKGISGGALLPEGTDLVDRKFGRGEGD